MKLFILIVLNTPFFVESVDTLWCYNVNNLDDFDGYPASGIVELDNGASVRTSPRELCNPPCTVVYLTYNNVNCTFDDRARLVRNNTIETGSLKTFLDSCYNSNRAMISLNPRSLCINYSTIILTPEIRSTTIQKIITNSQTTAFINVTNEIISVINQSISDDKTLNSIINNSLTSIQTLDRVSSLEGKINDVIESIKSINRSLANIETKNNGDSGQTDLSKVASSDELNKNSAILIVTLVLIVIGQVIVIGILMHRKFIRLTTSNTELTQKNQS